MRRSTIEWTDDTWNPTDGCLVCSPGCANCYAMRMAGRFSGPGQRYEGLVSIGKNKRAIWTGGSRLNSALGNPLSWRKPRKVFVDSMSDLFFEGLSDEDIAAVFAIMAACPHLTFQILTKRAARMRAWYRWFARRAELVHPVITLDEALRQRADTRTYDRWSEAMRTVPRPFQWPLPNVWQGVSVENQNAATERIPELIETPGLAVRFLSCEPLLSYLHLTPYLLDLSYELLQPPLHWVIVGCESGPGARPCDVKWLRSLRDQCVAAGVPFFLKQSRVGDGISSTYAHRPNDVISRPSLDGKVHHAFPAVAA